MARRPGGREEVEVLSVESVSQNTYLWYLPTKDQSSSCMVSLHTRESADNNLPRNEPSSPSLRKL